MNPLPGQRYFMTQPLRVVLADSSFLCCVFFDDSLLLPLPRLFCLFADSKEKSTHHFTRPREVACVCVVETRSLVYSHISSLLFTIFTRSQIRAAMTNEHKAIKPAPCILTKQMYVTTLSTPLFALLLPQHRHKRHELVQPRPRALP